MARMEWPCLKQALSVQQDTLGYEMIHDVDAPMSYHTTHATIRAGKSLERPRRAPLVRGSGPAHPAQGRGGADAGPTWLRSTPSRRTAGHRPGEGGGLAGLCELRMLRASPGLGHRGSGGFWGFGAVCRAAARTAQFSCTALEERVPREDRGPD